MSLPEDFAVKWEAAKITAAASLGAGADAGPSLKLEEAEADILLSGGLSTPSESPDTPNIASSAPGIDLASPENRSPTPVEDENDRDYVPEDSDRAPIPITFGALKSAGKKRPNPFAPPERDAKKRNLTPLGKILSKVQRPNKRNGLEQVRLLRYTISKCKMETGSLLTDRLITLRTFLIEIPHNPDITEDFILATKILDEGGLPDVANQRGCPFEHDLVADAQALIYKWTARDFDADILRGIDYNIFESNGKKKVKSRKLKTSYPKKSHAYVGQGTLTNGQWWPLQICLLRDGAHGGLESGISGASGGVAHSVVISKSGYGNIDNGYTVEYCGTASKTTTPTLNTQMLLESVKQGTPVRLIRSGAGGAAPYLPVKGLRYDGLYDVTGYEVLDQATAMHRFSLRRQPGQPPIRHTGVGARPTYKEIEVWRTIRGELKLHA